MKTKPSTNLFLLAAAILIFGLVVNTASTTNTVVAIGFCAALVVALIAAFVKIRENKKINRP
ncbi:hypothetical protein [Brevibacterium oceani]|uniref:hypothetical protein n=1 Tax=Brevibacterium oceani TaxID=358099 RepID=UPI0015E6DE99|nr:hypothetical protein [Brevibacterium oceani]